VHHLALNDEKLEEFDTRYKVTPPLRTDADRLALIEGVKNGTIDMITSDHNPIDIEHKKMDFDTAKNGTIGLESAFGALLTVLPVETVVEKLTSGRALFGLKIPSIIEGTSANLSLFNPDGKNIFTTDKILSKSKNSAFIGNETKGIVYGILNQNQLILNQ
jgi:dihydroorotase